MLDDLYLPDIIRCKLSKIFINGIWIGCTSDQVFEVRMRYVKLRRESKLHHHTTIYVDIMHDILYIWTDSGRVVRPLIIVHKGENETDFNGDHVRLTIQTVNDLITRK
jgi:hypothetical protein